MFSFPPTIFFLQFQVCHYTKRIAEAKNEKELLFLETELHRIKTRLNSLLN